ncbi:hypothetical protein I3760_15G140900 [Carya illinoinensis]|nr:hypothetical protein I3760_15G140900 [Carya illinoinensis]KAG2668016.1 hypothetical protein I3760_15G140900 [Carya illinoinensis]KAG2668017.1 hypothetical protein I3760_15G140900 [Carya illinoinensis]KAG2668018.1 hypothetical protein I3760_15G140900 [Carya illinoinensis]
MSNIIPFPKRNDPTAQDFPPGRQVLAVYPGTTALYKATVVNNNHKLQQLKILSLGACSGLGVLRKKVEVGHLNDYFGRIIFPVDAILEWFNHCKEASNNSESREIDIDGSDL